MKDLLRFSNGRDCSTVDDELKHVPDAGFYAPVTVLVDERADSVHLSYDKMANLLAPNANAAGGTGQKSRKDNAASGGLRNKT